MNRRKFLRAAGVAGIAGITGCSSPFDPISTPEPMKNGSGATSGDGSGGGGGGGGGSNGGEADGALTTTPEAPKTRSGAALTGVYPGNTDLTTKLAAYSDWLSGKPAVVVVFVDALGDPGDTKGFVEGALTDIWNAGHVPMVSWQPFLKKKAQTPEQIELQIARGKYDDALQTWAKALDNWARPHGEKTRGRRFYFRPAHEMNGNWFPWSAVDATRIPASASGTGNGKGEAGTPEDYISMWKRLHKIFGNTGMDETNIQWVWSPNADEPGNSIRAEKYYPGDDYVDWVGIDGFNFGDSRNKSTWRTPETLFDPVLKRMQKLTDKPIGLTEFASSSIVNTENGRENRPQRKAEWIQQVFEYVAENDIKMACWFNHDKSGGYERDWAVLGGSYGTSKTTVDGKQYSVYPTYKRTLAASKFLGALPDYPPLLTDDEFAGKF